MSTARPRVFLADDHDLILTAFTSLLSESCDIVGTAADGRQLVEQAPAAAPDVVVLDIGMPRLNGIDAARELRALLPDLNIVFLTVTEDPELATEALDAVPGASFMLKSGAATELLRAIRTAHEGRSYVTPAVARAVAENPHHLTPRQRQVLALLAKGLLMKQVAGELGITPRTVAHHKYSMMAALGIDSGAELVRFAVRRGLVS